MYLLWVLVGAAAALAAVPPVASAALKGGSESKAHSAIIAFGDSFSDNGSGAWVITNHTWPANPHYAGGRFSNGRVWIEYVAGNLSVPLVDYAVGGATTSNALVQGYTGHGSTVPVPSVDQQVARFLKIPPKNVSLAKPLFFILAGINDAFFNPNVTAGQSFSAIMASRAALAALYPHADIVLLSYPDLSQIPYDFYVDAPTKHELGTFGSELAGLCQRAQLQYKGLTHVDLTSLFANFGYYGTPAAYGFAPLGAYGSCLTGSYGETKEVTLCKNPDEMVFWDEYHPTTHTHSWVADVVLDALGHR